jgi:hypothetical protein
MKKPILYSLFFCGGVLAVYLILFAITFFIRPGGIPLVYRITRGMVWEGGPTWIKFRQFDSKEKYDIMVLGSSHALNGYDPEVFKEKNYRMFNFGSSNQNTICTYNIAKNYIHKGNCKLVIIDVFDRIFAKEYLESVSDFIQNIDKDKAAFDIAVQSGHPATINMLTLRLFNKLTPPLNRDTAGHVNGAFIFKRFYNPKERKKQEKGWTYNPQQRAFEYLEKTITLLQDQNIPVVLVQHPSIPNTLPSHPAFARDIQKMAVRLRIPYLDYTEAPGFGGIQNFADRTHLNHIGVRKYNNLLIEELESKGYLYPGPKALTSTQTDYE